VVLDETGAMVLAHMRTDEAIIVQNLHDALMAKIEGLVAVVKIGVEALECYEAKSPNRFGATKASEILKSELK